MRAFLRVALFAICALVFAGDPAQATNKFLIGCATTCTWDNTVNTIWSTSSGGVNNTTHPVAGDDVTIDNNSCSGGTTCTITLGAVTIAANTITWGTCTASTTGCIVDGNTNNPNFTLTSSGGTNFSGTGTGTRKWLAGTGTYTLTMTGANSCFDMSTSTNDQGSTFNSATWVCSGSTTNNRSWKGGGFSFGPTTFSGNASGGSLSLQGNNTFNSLTVGAPNYVQNAVTTTTVTNAFTTSGSSSSSLIAFETNSVDTPTGMSIGPSSAVSWISIRGITFSGTVGGLVGTNCFNLGRNTLNSGTCAAPTTGGGGRIIGG